LKGVQNLKVHLNASIQVFGSKYAVVGQNEYLRMHCCASAELVGSYNAVVQGEVRQLTLQYAKAVELP